MSAFSQYSFQTDPSSNEYLVAKFGLMMSLNQVRCTLIARGYLGLFSFLFYERDCSTLLACLLASIQPRTSLVKFAALRVQITDPPGFFEAEGELQILDEFAARKLKNDARLPKFQFFIGAFSVGWSVIPHYLLGRYRS